MSEPPSQQAGPPPDLPPPVIRPRTRWLPSIVWLVPLIAALVGVSLAVQSVVTRGPTITISFTSAEGLDPGKTQVKYKDVNIGTVTAITLAPDRSHALVAIQLDREDAGFAVKASRFWVVRPRIALTGVTGLSTLLSGAYIGVDAGRSSPKELNFVGLETPPAVTSDKQGHHFTLHGDSPGSVNIGSPVYYRRVRVGDVVGTSLDRDGNGVTIQVFVNAPYDQHVGDNTRWWNASGVDLSLDSNGLRLNTQSLATVVLGGIAFQAPPNQVPGPPAPDAATFHLAASEGDAMQEPDGPAVNVVMDFDQSLRGLSVGAPVDFRGIVLGNVRNIAIGYDPKTRGFRMPVTMTLYPDRLGKRFEQAVPGAHSAAGEALLQQLVKRGLRGQLRTGNLLTGQLYVALDFFPNASPTKVDPASDPPRLPTVPNTLAELQLQVADIAKRLDQVPFDEIGNNLNGTLTNANGLFRQLDTQLVPQAQGTLTEARKTFAEAQSTLQQNSPLQSDVHQALQELTRTLQSLDQLSDYLEQHPESLLRGKSSDTP